MSKSRKKRIYLSAEIGTALDERKWNFYFSMKDGTASIPQKFYQAHLLSKTGILEMFCQIGQVLLVV
jgi:hypothetical protein